MVKNELANYENYIEEKYMNKRVTIKYTNKLPYIKEGVVGMCGVVTRTSSKDLGVLIDGKTNKASSYGIYWFNKDEVKIIKDEKNESEDIKMEGFQNIAIVNLLEDYNKKDYAFALYDEDFKKLCGKNYLNTLVVVNANGKNNRLLGNIKEVFSVEGYYDIDANKGRKITAEVVGVVNMDRYIAREEEKVRLAELEKKKAAIEKELEEEINKRKSVEYYEEMAKKYADNPKLAELVAELKNLGA